MYATVTLFSREQYYRKYMDKKQSGYFGMYATVTLFSREQYYRKYMDKKH